MFEATASRQGRRPRPRGIIYLARVTAASLVTSAALIAAPVVSIGSADQTIEPMILEQPVTADAATVRANFDLAAVVLDQDDIASEVEVRVRDEDGWGDWTALEVIAEDDGPDPATAVCVSVPLNRSLRQREIEVGSRRHRRSRLIDGGTREHNRRVGQRCAVHRQSGWGADEPAHRTPIASPATRRPWSTTR